ncbi:Muc22p [Xylographa pallens]|nr:Muc22p [Xylographa pallens]
MTGYIVMIAGTAIDVGHSELSGNTLAALQDFYNDRDAQQKRFQELKLATESNSQQKLSMDMFTEDWNASQFWYNDETALILAKEILDDATANTCIAVVSAPSAFIQIKNLLASAAGTDKAHCPELCLLEFDDRFALLKEFARSYNQTSSSIEVTAPSSSTSLDLPSAANVASQTLTPLLISGTYISTTSAVTSTSSPNPSGQVGQVPAFANDPGASTIANDASATLFSRSFTLGTDISTAIPTSAVQQGVPSSGPTTNTVTISSSSSSQPLSTIKTLDTSPVSLSFQTVISPTLSTLTSSIVPVTPTTNVIISTASPMTMASPGSFSGFSTSTVPVSSTITLDSSSTTAQSYQAVTSTQSAGVSIAAAATSIPSTTFSAIATTIVASSSTISSATTNATAPNPQNSNLVMALAYNAIFDTLTADSDCSAADSSSAVACISGMFAQCGSDGKYTLASCPRGQQCFALPLPGGDSGVSVQCDSSEDGASKLGLAAPEATGVVSTAVMSSTAVLSPLTYSTSSTAIVPQASIGAQSSMASFTTLASSTRSTVIIPQVSIAAQSTTIDITPLASSASPTVIASQLVTSTSNSIAGSSTRVASPSGTVQTTGAPDLFSSLTSLTTVLVQPSYTTSTSIAPKATSVLAPTENSSFDSQPFPTSTEVPILSIATSMLTSSLLPPSPLQASAPMSSSSSSVSPSTSTIVVLITESGPSATQAATYPTFIPSPTALSSSMPVVPTPAFTIVPVKNNATPTITETITETVTVSATVTVRG